MTSALPFIEMEQEAKCPVCLDFLTDPIVLDCGHSFCQGCITYYCETWEALEETLECPTCKCKIQKGGFRRNWTLANLVETIKLIPRSSEKEGLCLRHKENLHLFCKEDEKLVCSFCEQPAEHQGHTILPLEEVAQQYMDKFVKCLETLRSKREKFLVYLAEAEDKSQEMLKIMESERQQRVAEFRTLHQLLKEQEHQLLAQIEEVEMEIARKRDEHRDRLSKVLASLESLIQEIEEKQQQPVSELLQDVRGTLQRCKKKEMFQNREAFPSKLKWRFWNCCYNPFLENAMKQFKDTQGCLLLTQKAMVTLDPASASSHLILSGDQKSMTWQSTAQDSFEDPEKHYGFVLGGERFTSGCHFWQVFVGRGEGWAVGVARKTVRSRVTFTPEEGIWAVGRWKGRYKAFIKDIDPPLTLRGRPYCIRVCLNYNWGQVAFFDASTTTLLYEFSRASFCGETLCPFFVVYGDGNLWIYP